MYNRDIFKDVVCEVTPRFASGHRKYFVLSFGTKFVACAHFRAGSRSEVVETLEQQLMMSGRLADK